MIQRTILEWGRLPYGPDPADPFTIPLAAADRIAAVAAVSPLTGRGGNGVLEHGRHALRARSVVGVIAAEGCALEILPKIDVQEAEGTQEATIRRRLVHMLAVALDMRIDVGAITDLDWQRETVLEILIRVFSEKLADALRQGVPRRYVSREDDLRALRGSLDATRQFTRHAVNPSRLACRFDELFSDIALNRIMKAAITRLQRITQSMSNRRRLQELAFAYADISDVPALALRWDQVVLDRTNSRWGELLNLARLLLSERFQTSTSGASSGFSLLFDMNVLFEEYVGRLIGRALAGSGLRVSLQGGRLHCLTDEATGQRLFRTKPDILIRDSCRVIHVIDTKWKRISSRVDDPKRGVGQADVYQMMAYGRLYQASRLTLLFPHHAGLEGRDGRQAIHRIGGDEAWLETASFDVSHGRNALERLRRLLLDHEKGGLLEAV